MDLTGSAEKYRRSEAPDVGNSPRVLVVMYHYVHDRKPSVQGAAAGNADGVRGLTTDQFTAQVEQLGRELEPIDWPRLYAWMDGRGQVPQRSFLLTFDDGLADHAKTVLPILNHHDLRGVFFVPGSVLVECRLLPAHAIHLLLSTLGDERLAQELGAYLRGREDGRVWADALERDEDASLGNAAAMYHYETPQRARLKHLLTMELPIAMRRDALETLFARHIGSASRWSKHWYLGWEDLVALRSHGHTVGGHGFRHEPYSRLSPREVREDVSRTAAILREGLGPDLRPFSYPYGSVTDDAVAACREAGFAHAFTTESRSVDDTCDLMRLPRIDTIHVGAVLEKELSCSQA